MTRKFRFPLQPVLEHRTRIEEERQQEVAVALRAVNEALSALRRLHDDFRTHSDALRSEHQRFTTEELRLHYAHLEYLNRAITAQEGAVAAAKAAHEQCRLRLVEASKEKKAIEKLKSRRHEAHIAAETVVEQREIDDMNARRFSRSSAGGA